MKIQMKLKYTLVFTIISFFISTAGFAQQYTDEEIGFDVEKLTIALKKHGDKYKDIPLEISNLRENHKAKYLYNLKKQETQKLEASKTAKSSKVNVELASPEELAQDRAALIAFYNSTGGANWYNSQQGKGAWPVNDPNAIVTSWDPNTNSGWYGITTEPSGRVTGINIENNNLNGNLPPQIGQLTKLYYLILKNNTLLSGNIPNQIIQLQDLVFLNIEFSSLSGNIPSSLGLLPNLLELDLSYNSFSGTIPIEILNMSRLKILNLASNKLTGNIPPQVGNLSDVETLNLEGNELTGSIPVEINNLSKAEWIQLFYNQLTGSIPPPQIGQLPNLKEYHLRNNNLSGNLPSEIKNLTNLRQLNVDYNQLTGSLLPEFGELKNVYALSLRNNNLTGIIPAEIGEMTNLYSFDVADNKLTGNIPETFQKLKKLENIYIFGNKFSGKIPNLTVIPLKNFQFHFNAFRFIDFADEHAAYKNMVYQTSPMWYSYCQQAFIDEEKTIIKNSGDSVTFTMYEDGRFTPNETYQWYHFHGDTTREIPGATSRSYTIPNIKFKDSGSYHCVSTNPYITNKMYWETNLYLTKNKIHLNVNVTCTPTEGSIKVSSENITANQDINFSFETTASNLTYYWTFFNTDNTVMSTATGSMVSNMYYPLPGTYKINVVVTDENLCTTSFDKIITIAPQVCPSITGSITSQSYIYVNAYTILHFDSPQDDFSYEWTVYDLENNVSDKYYWSEMDKAFEAPGNYKINLAITDSNRCTTNFEKFITVTQAASCTSAETGTINTGGSDTIYTNTNQEFNFSWDSYEYLYLKWTIYNPDNSIYDTFKGDNYWSGLNFSIPGQYKVVVELTDMSGCTATINKTFTVINDCRKNGAILTTEIAEVPQVLANTSIPVLLYPYDFDLTGKLLSWTFTNPAGEVIATGNSNIFTVTPPTIGDYQISIKITDPNTGCENNFKTILSCIDECQMSNSERGGKITLNGEYAIGEETIYLDLNQPINVGLNRTYYTDTGRPLSFEWSLLDSHSQVINTGNNTLFPIELTSPGFYKVVLKVTDSFNGCSTNVTRAFASKMQNSCTQTNERALEVQELARALAKKLLQRTANGETDAQINNNNIVSQFIALKPFITNSPKDKIYNYKTTRDTYNAINSVSFSFSPDREHDFSISMRDAIYPNGVTPDYLDYLIDKAVYIDVSQFISSNDFLVSCNTYDQNGRSAKTILEPKDCRYSSEIKNINFCPPPCTPIVGNIKTSSVDIFTNRKINFSFETSATDLTYKWTFYDLGNTNPTVYNTNTVERTYTAAGNYTVNLEITDATGCVTTIEKTVTATVNTNCIPLSGTIITSTTDVFVGRNTNFSLETTATDLSYKWTFAQGSESTIFTTKTVDYIYIQPGTNNVILEVTDSNGCKSTFQKLVELKTGSTLCNDVTQFGRAFVQVGNDTNLFKSATVSVNQTTNVTFSSQNYGPGADFEYKWRLLNENGQLVDSGTNLNFPITPTRGGLYTIILDLKENTSGCIHQLTRAVVCTISNSCAQTNPESANVKGLVINLLKNLMARAMMGESDSQINSSAVTAEFNALKPYITSGPKDKIYNFASTRNLNGEFTSVDFSFSPDRVSDIHISVPHGLQYSQGMPLDYLQSSMIEPKLYIDLSQYTSANQYLISCFSDSQSAKGLLKPNDCVRASEIRYIDFCPGNCNTLIGVIKTNTENTAVNTAVNFSLETNATGLSYNWTFYNPDNSVRENQTTANVSHTYTVPGTYKVQLDAKDVNNCITTLTKMITVAAPACVAAIGTIKTVSPNIFTGTNTEFLFETTATNLTYEWTLYRNVSNNTAIFTTNTANIYYLDPGNYNVKLIVTDANGCKNTFRTTVTATVKPPCVNVIGEIKTANPIISTNENTTFSFETTATILRYYWTFHSLNNTPLLNTTESSPTLMYTFPNNYKVTLTVWDENDCYTIIEKNINVVRGCPAIAGSANIPETAATGQIIPFEYNTTSNGVGYKWTFYNLDGSIKSTATTSKVNKAYYAAGDYRVTLELSDLFNIGCNTFIDKIVKVTGECNISGTIESNPADGGITLDQYVYFRFESDAIDVKYKWTVTTPDNVSTVYSTDKYAPYYFQSGSGLYKIAVEVSDGYGCTLNLEKTYNLEYDCSRNTGLVTGSIYNNNHKFYYSSDVLIDAPNKFTFWHNNSSNENLPVSWELTDLNGTLISSGTEKEFIFTPTTSAGLILKLTITDQYGCPHHFSKELNVVEKCQFYVRDISGDINFDEEYSYKVAFIDANQTKDLILRSYDENDGKVYTYQWNLYDLDGALVSTGSQQKFPITLSNAGFYKVTLDIIDPDTDCPIQFTKKIGCVINNSCTENNPKSQIVKDLFLNLIRSLIIRGSIGETDEQINNSEASPEFIALKPYITNGPKDKIYNFKTRISEGEEPRFEGFDFSFSPDRQSDVHYYTRWAPYFDPWDIENSIERINQTLYFTLNQYVSADQSLVSCYVDYGGKIAGKNVNRLDEEDCTHQLAVQYIDFCPAEDCTPITGTLKSTTVLGVQTGDKKILLKPASRK